MASYIVRDIDPELWQRVKDQARRQVPNIAIKDLIEALFTAWLRDPRICTRGVGSAAATTRGVGSAVLSVGDIATRKDTGERVRIIEARVTQGVGVLYRVEDCRFGYTTFLGSDQLQKVDL